MAENILCAVDGCGKDSYCKGWCQKHYYLLREGPRCAAAGCERPSQSKGYCTPHYARFKRHGDPEGGISGKGAKLRWLKANKDYGGGDCLKWPFPYGQNGYGTVQIDLVIRSASRVMCELAHGRPDLTSMDAAHSCGNGKHGCLNPRHLRWATRSENHMDAVAHGTHPGLSLKGERHHNAKLTSDVVMDIRRKAGAGVRQADLCMAYGLSSSLVSRIVNRHSWTHI